MSDTDIAAAVLSQALDIVTGARRGTYGTPEDNFRNIAELWNAYLSGRMRRSAALGSNDPRPIMYAKMMNLDATDVAILMGLMKLARLIETPTHRDSWVDAAGYAGCGARCAEVNMPGALVP